MLLGFRHRLAPVLATNDVFFFFLSESQNDKIHSLDRKNVSSPGASSAWMCNHLRSVSSAAGQTRLIYLNKCKPLAFPPRKEKKKSQIRTLTCRRSGKETTRKEPKGPNGKLNRVKYLRLSLQLPTSSPPAASPFPPNSLAQKNHPLVPFFFF